MQRHSGAMGPTPDLFAPITRKGDSIVPPVRSRNADPATSHVAAARVVEFDANHFGRIVAALKKYGPGTFHDIAAWLLMDGQQVNKRLPELERVGAVVRTGETRPSPAGRQCAVWRAV